MMKPKDDKLDKKFMKLKQLNPTLRIKSRYVLFELLSENVLNIVKLIEDKCKYLYGIIGFASMDFRKISYDNNSKTGIIMVNRKSVDKLKASFVFLKKENIIVNSIYVSGSLKKIKQKQVFNHSK